VGERGFFRYRRPHFFVQKTREFSKFMVCPHGQGWLSQCGHFSDKGGVNFSRFCADVFYGRPLSKNCNEINILITLISKTRRRSTTSTARYNKCSKRIGLNKLQFKPEISALFRPFKAQTNFVFDTQSLVFVFAPNLGSVGGVGVHRRH